MAFNRIKGLKGQIMQTSAARLTGNAARSVMFFIAVRALSTHEYGALVLIQTSLFLAAIVGSLNLYSYLIRALPACDPGTQIAVFRRLMRLIIPLNLFIGIVGALLWHRFGVKVSAFDLCQIAAVYFLDVLCVNAENLLIGKQDISCMNQLTVLRYGVPAVISVVLALMQRLTISGVLGAWLVGDIVSLAVCTELRYWNILAQEPPMPNLWRDALRYSLPLLVSNITDSSMRSADRYLIAYFLGIGALAPYDLGYKIVNSVYGLTALTANTVLVPRAMAAQNLNEMKNRDRAILRTTKVGVYSLVLCLAALLLIPGKWIGKVSGHSSYAVAGILAILLATALLAKVLGSLPALILLAHNNSRAIAAADLLGLVVSVVTSILLVPVVGLYGAALAAIAGLSASALTKYICALSGGLLIPRHFYDWSDERNMLAGLGGVRNRRLKYKTAEVDT